MKLLNFLSGKKTFIIAAVAIIYGFSVGNMEIVMNGFAAIGLRQAIFTSAQ